MTDSTTQAAEALAAAKAAIDHAAEALGVQLPDVKAPTMNDAIRAKAGVQPREPAA